MNDYKAKKISKRLKITLAALRNNYTSLELTELLSRLASLYYKTDLLYSITLCLSCNDSISDILLSQRPLHSNNITNIFPEYSLNNDIEFFHKLHFFNSILPNDRYTKLGILSDCCRETNTLLYNNGYKTIFNRISSEILKKSINYSFNDSVNTILQSTLEINPSINKNTDITSNLKQIRMKYNNKYKEYENDLELIEKFKELIAENFSLQKNDPLRKIEKKYVDPFFNTFDNDGFALLLFNNKEKLKTLCNYHFNESNDKNTLHLDIKNVSHQSPYTITFSCGSLLLMPLLSVWKLIREEQLENKTIKQINDDTLELIDDYEIYCNENSIFFSNILQQVDSEYLINRISIIKNKLKDNYALFLRDFSLIIEKMNRI